MTRPVVTALLYASLVLAAIPASAANLGSALRDNLLGMRDGDLVKLQLHEQAKPLDGLRWQRQDGSVVTLEDSNGKIRLLNFWATWCAPCRAEKPTLDALNGAMNSADFEVIAVATGRNTPAALKRFHDQVPVKTLETYLDPKSELAQSLGVLGLPATILIDRDGNEIGRLMGSADWNTGTAEKMFTYLIAPD